MRFRIRRKSAFRHCLGVEGDGLLCILCALSSACRSFSLLVDGRVETQNGALECKGLHALQPAPLRLIGSSSFP